MTTDDFSHISISPEKELDWENRRLCIDESCIGVIGTDGRCRICGILDPNASIRLKNRTDGHDDSEPLTENPMNDPVDVQQGSAWDDRTLCKDESCIGTIGEDGRCRVCGVTG